VRSLILHHRKENSTGSDGPGLRRDSSSITSRDYATSPEPMDDDDEPATDETKTAPGTKLERWRPPGPGEAPDPIDEIMSGWKGGRTREPDQDSDDEDESSKRNGNQLRRMSEESGSDGDDFRVSVEATISLCKR
jgi:hypothetical protein